MPKRRLEDREIGTTIDKRFGLGKHCLEVERDLDGFSGTVELLGDVTHLVAGRKKRFGLSRNFG